VAGRWLVDLAGRPATQPARATSPDDQAVAGRDELVARLEADVLYLQGALEREQVANAELRRLLAAHMPQLPAPDVPATPPVVPEKPPARPWWAFWRDA
jgi:hypothetical protein